MANGGTLFLDEIGDISQSTQVKLLRVLQEKEFERLGGTHTIKVDIRLIAATNKDLEAEVQAGKFREDLYYRLNVIPILLPSLRERKEDVPALANYFLQKSTKENGKKVKFFSDEAMDYLVNYSWPGNVRELENAIERAVVLCKSDTLTPDLFPIPGIKRHQATPPNQLSSGSFSPADLTQPLPDAVSSMEKKMIQEALSQTKGNQRKAAQLLGITERMLGYKVKTYGLK